VVTSGDGLYADGFEEGRYVYKGASPDNYITFNGEEADWRIISVEKDGTLKIIKNDTIGSMSWDEPNFRDAGSNGVGGTYCSNAVATYGCNAWMTSDNFVNNTYTGNVLLDATINTYLNTTYKTEIDTENVVDHEFPVGSAVFENEDLAVQIADENSVTWTGKIGLINLSDYIRTNTNIAECGTFSLNNKNYDICQNTTWVQDIAKKTTYGWFWTMTARSANYQSVFEIHNDSTVVGRRPHYLEPGVVPTIFLSPKILLDGSGTEIDPYEIVS